jgi:hypothetical protein
MNALANKKDLTAKVKILKPIVLPRPRFNRGKTPFAALKTGKRSAPSAPLRLIYVADLDKFRTAGYQEPGLHDPEIRKSYYYVDAGLIAGNVYLYAAAYELAAWFHNCNKRALAKKLNLRSSQRILFGKTVGYPGME